MAKVIYDGITLRVDLPVEKRKNQDSPYRRFVGGVEIGWATDRPNLQWLPLNIDVAAEMVASYIGEQAEFAVPPVRLEWVEKLVEKLKCLVCLVTVSN